VTTTRPDRPTREVGGPGVALRRPGAVGGSTALSIDRVLALLLVGLAPVRLELVSGLSVGLAAALALGPVWVRHLRRWTGAGTVVVLVALSLAAGAWLTAIAAVDHDVTFQGMRLWIGLMVGLAATVGVVLWARSMVHDGTVAVVYGLGLLASNLMSVGDQTNAWKSSFSLPLTMILLGFAWSRSRRGLSVVLALGLAVTSALNDSRSHFAMVLLAAGAVVWQTWFRGRGRRRSAAGSIVLAGVLGVAVLNLGQAMMLEGYLGEETQARTQGQIERSGSVLLGGRPELGATLALMAHRPMGLGYGTLPGMAEMRVAKSGMATLNYDPDNGYVHNFMFGGVLKLHSVVGDSWSMFGPVGVVLALTIAVIVVRRLGGDLATGTLSALMAFLSAKVVWDLFFGPLYSALPVLGLTIGLALLPRRGRPPAPGAPPRADVA